MLSIIIPSYNEPYLLNTLQSVLDTAKGDIEVFVNVDDGMPIEMPKKDSRVTFNYPDKPLGMRGGINKGLAQAKGKYVMKCDAHCVFAEGFDTEIVEHMEDNWLVIPRRYSLYADGWKRDRGSIAKDYHYLHFPITSSLYGTSTFPIEWRDRRLERNEHLIDDTMTFQGSCYVANRNYFMKHVGYLDEKNFGSFGGEQLEVGLKYWFRGGQVKVNKNTWYAHLFKNSRYYKEMAGSDLLRHKMDLKKKGGWELLTKRWMNNEEPNMKHKFSWLVEKFWPVPSWPQDRSLWTYSK
jgi:glycosyltransferase involved in cell wall biosynthesis